MSDGDPYAGAQRQKTTVRMLAPLWAKVGETAEAADELGINTSRGEVLEALVHFHAPTDPEKAERLVRDYRLARRGRPPST